MTQEIKRRIVIDTNRHGIRREINLDKVAKKATKRKEYQKKTER